MGTTSKPPSQKLWEIKYGEFFRHCPRHRTGFENGARDKTSQQID